MIPVYHEDRHVGDLSGGGSEISFAYDPDWVDAENSFPVSATMPLQGQDIPIAISTNWFANLLPEEAQLRAFAKLNQAHPADIFSLLQKTGKEAAGALSIGAPEAPGRYLPRDESELACDIAKLPARPLLAGEEDFTLSLAGAQSKMVVAVLDGEIALPLNGAASTHILKPENQLNASLENEALCMRLAAAVGLNAAPVRLGLADDTRYLLIERYDRFESGPHHYRRLHQEDAAQALGLSPLQKYQSNGGPALESLFGHIGRTCLQPVLDRLELRDRTIFNACIANTDAHAKNFSFMISGGYRLAPAYDLLSGAPYAEITKNMAMKIGGQRAYRYIDAKAWQEMADTCRLAPGGLLRRIAEIGERILKNIEPESERLASESVADITAITYIADEIRAQTNRILAGI